MLAHAGLAALFPQSRYLGKQYTALSLEDILKEIALDTLDTDTKEWLRGVGLIKGWAGLTVCDWKSGWG